MKHVVLAIAGALLAGVTAAGASPATAAATHCTGHIGPGVTIAGDVTAGPGCDLDVVTVTGDVIVEKGGSLSTFFSQIDGDVESRRATSVNIGLFTSIDGSVEIRGSSESAGVFRTVIGGDLVFAKNVGSVQAIDTLVEGSMEVSKNVVTFGNFSGDTIGGDAEVVKNRGDIEFGNSAITGTLDCHGNNPPVTAYLNTVGSAQGECA
jgi:hypothetical protein